MTRKHFQAFAGIIAGEVACLAPHEHERRETLRRVMLSTADLFAREDERFDRDRFYAACGLDRYAEQRVAGNLPRSKYHGPMEKR